MEYPDLKEIERRPKQYWNADGLPDLLMGMILITWSAGFFILQRLPAGDWRSKGGWVILLLLVASGYIGNWAIKKLKQRMTFPRTGYVEWRKPGVRAHVATAVLAACVAAGLGLLGRYGNIRELSRLAPPAVGLLFAGGFLIAATWHRLPHLLFSSALSLMLAGIIAWAKMDFPLALIFYFFCLGVLFCLMGFVRLRLYLQRHPQPPASEV